MPIMTEKNHPYRIHWLDKKPNNVVEKRTIYLEITKDGLFYIVLDPNNQLQTKKISFNKILDMHHHKACPPEHEIVAYEFIPVRKDLDGLTYHVRHPNNTLQTYKLSLEDILKLVEHEHIYVESNDIKKSLMRYCYFFILHALSHPITKTLTMIFLIIATALAFSSIAVNIAYGIAIVAAGILITGLFAPKKTSKFETEPHNTILSNLSTHPSLA